MLDIRNIVQRHHSEIMKHKMEFDKIVGEMSVDLDKNLTKKNFEDYMHNVADLLDEFKIKLYKTKKQAMKDLEYSKNDINKEKIQSLIDSI